MKILNISLDKKVLDKNSAVAKRILDYEKLVDKYTIISLDSGKGKLANFLNIYSEAKKILKQERYDVITVQDAYFVGWLAVKLARKFKAGLEVQAHGFEKFNFIRKTISKYVLTNVDSIRVVSQRLREKLIMEFKVDAGKITVVPVYTEVGSTKSEVPARNAALYLHSVAGERSNDNNNFIFLTVGRLVPVKNIGMQIAALKNTVETRHGASEKIVKLWIIGDGSQRRNLELRVKKLGLENNIEFLGWQNNLNEFYQKADAFLLTSNSEGWGMAVVEAAQFGLPIIMTDVGLAGEVIKDGESGIIIPVGDQKALETAMIRIIENEDLRKKLGAGALKEVKKLPTKEQTIKKMISSWQKAIHLVK